MSPEDTQTVISLSLRLIESGDPASAARLLRAWLDTGEPPAPIGLGEIAERLHTLSERVSALEVASPPPATSPPPDLCPGSRMVTDWDVGGCSTPGCSVRWDGVSTTREARHAVMQDHVAGAAE